MLTEDVSREDPAFTQITWDRLLEWLDDGVPSNGERYMEIRRRLVSYFDRRDGSDPDGLADDTFNRIARTLAEQGAILITPPAKYCYVVARFVLLEDFRRLRRHVPLRQDYPRGSRDDAAVTQEHRLNCLDRCLQALRPDQRELIVDYYRDSRRQKINRRRDIARRLRITMNALSIRVWRIRDTLTACMERCGK